MGKLPLETWYVMRASEMNLSTHSHARIGKKGLFRTELRGSLRKCVSPEGQKWPCERQPRIKALNTTIKGRQRFLFHCVLGLFLSSSCCPLSPSLFVLVPARWRQCTAAVISTSCRRTGGCWTWTVPSLATKRPSACAGTPDSVCFFFWGDLNWFL